MTQIQRRDVSIELRAEKKGDKSYIRGYAVRYGMDSQDLGGFIETIDKEAFKELMERGDLDVVSLFNHSADNLLGRTPNTLTLRNDDNGLFMETELPDTELGRSVFTAIQRGDLKGQSFSFSNFEATWSKDFTRRNITKISNLYDVGPVTFPAYPDTNVAARDREAAMAAAEEERRQAIETQKLADEAKEIEKRAADQAAKPADPATKHKREPVMDPKELRNKAQECSDRADVITNTAKSEERELTDEEVESIAACTEEQTKYLRRAKVLEAQIRAKADLKKVDDLGVLPNEPSSLGQPVKRDRVFIPLRHNLRSFKNDSFGTVKQANDAAYRSGMFMLAALCKVPAAVEYCRTHGIAIGKDGTGGSVQRATGINLNVSSGYLVPDEMERALINVIDQYGLARKYCRQHRMNSDTMTVPIRDAGLTAYAIGENTEITESDKTWTNAELVARKWGVLVKYASEISEDAIIDMADDLTQEMGSAFAGTEDDCWLNGDGSNTYHGIQGIWNLIEADTWTGSLFDCAAANDTLAEITSDDLALCFGKMPNKYRQGGMWLCNPFTKAVVFDGLASAAGGNTQREIAAGQLDTYAGYAIIESEKFYAPALASTVANDKVPILFGRYDIGCSFGNRRGMTIALSTDRYFELDQLAIRGTERFDISNHNANCGTAVGPVVGLALTT